MSIDQTLAAFELSNNLSKVVDRLRPSASQYLHYCSLEAFYSIISTGRLRFTSSKNTNDPSEFVFGQNIVLKALSSAYEKHGSGLYNLLNEDNSDFSGRDFRAFIFCMSEALEDESNVGELSQWRLYGSNGRGVALVFDDSFDSDRDNLWTCGSPPRRVVYGDEEGYSLVESEIEDFTMSILSLPEETLDQLKIMPTSSRQYLLNRLFWLPSVIKHRAYRHEREVRLIRGDIGEHVGNPLTFFERGSIQRPAIERQIAFPQGEAPNRINTSPIKAVVIGPSGDQPAIYDSIRYFLESREWNIDIRMSDIPYRALI